LEDNTEINLRGRVFGVVDLINLGNDNAHMRAVVNTAMDLLIPQNVGNLAVS
jgi:hypothetical protein